VRQAGKLGENKEPLGVYCVPLSCKVCCDSSSDSGIADFILDIYQDFVIFLCMIYRVHHIFIPLCLYKLNQIAD
jgi:hypothetical protein